MKTIETKNPKMARLEARVSTDEKQLFQHAAAIQGQTLTEFLVRCAHEGAKRTVREQELMKLTAKDREIFVSALLKPPSPGKRLKKAAKRYKTTMGI